MRILFTFVGGRGHFEPLVPIARAAVAAGHAVAFGCAPGATAMAEATGFEALPVGSAASRAQQRVPLRAPDPAREESELRERFVRVAARARLPYVEAIIDEWRPDVLVCDETDFGAMLAAERGDLPFASVIVIGAGGFVRPDVVGGALDELRAACGLPLDPELVAFGRHLVLSPFPPSYRDPAFPLPGTACSYRPDAAVASDIRGASAFPSWANTLPGAPVLHLTLGTVFNMESGDLLARLTAALRDLPANLLVTVGEAMDPAELGPQPGQVCVERYLPQAAVLPYCDVVVSHGGSGSVLAALGHGLPSLLVPLGADQPLNAKRCEALGVARVLDPMQLTPDRVRAEAKALLEDGACRRAAASMADEIAALPDVARAVDRIAALAGRPAAER